MKKRNLALTVIVLAVFATLALLRVSGTTNAQGPIANKAVLEVTLDRGDGYPGMGTPISSEFPFVIHPGEPQTLISVTSWDLLLDWEPFEPLDSTVAFYADIPLGCWGRWWDKGVAGPDFPANVYSVGGQPMAEPFSPEQLGITVPFPPDKVQGDQDVDPSVLEPGLPVPGQTFEVDLHFQTLPAGIEEILGEPIPITRFFDFHCDLPGEYVFWFCNKIEPMPPYEDPNFPWINPGSWPGDNVLCVPLSVVASTGVGGIAEAPDAEASPAQTDSGSSAATYAMAGGAAGLLIVLAAGGLYARRRLRAS